ncbi:MAG: hypothetical protein WAM70_04420, partial [Pyrinomonadaceae bacterium]
MIWTKRIQCRSVVGAGFISLVVVISVNFTTGVNAQTPNITLVGSEARSVTDGVDVFSGQLEQVLPLITIRGRGTANVGLYLPLRNTQWRVMETWSGYNYGAERAYYGYRADHSYFFNNQMTRARAGYSSLAKLEIETKFIGWFMGQTQSVTELRFTSNDGSIIKFRDVLTNGQPYDSQNRGCIFSAYQVPNPPPTCSRGRIFRSVDGSNITFVAEEDIHDMIFQNWFGPPSGNSTQNNVAGTFYLPDGRRVRVQNNFNNITRITDQNGNFTSFEYVTEPGYTHYFLKKITDSLNREVNIIYGDAMQPSFFDEIVIKGFGGSERRVRINYTAIENAMLPGHSLGVPLFPGVTTRCYIVNSGQPCDPTPGGPSGPHYASSEQVPSSIVLPNGQQYQFYYNKYLELARLKNPAGSFFDYGYSGGLEGWEDGFEPPVYSGGGTIFRRIASVKQFDDAGALVSEKTFSNVPQWVSQSNPSFPIVDNVTVNIKDAGGTNLSSHKRYFHFDLLFSMRHGREYKSEILDPITQAVLRRTETKWEQREPFPWCSTDFLTLYFCDNSVDPNGGPPVDPRITEIKTTLETAEVTKKTLSYDQYNNVIDTYEYDFGEGQPGPFLRRSHADYVTDANYTSHTGAYLLRLKS